MYSKLLAFFLALYSVGAETIIVSTNLRSNVSGPPAYELNGPAGEYRITYVVESTTNVPLALSSGTSFRLQIWASDGVRIYNLPNSNYVDTSLSAGQLRFAISNLNAGSYRFHGVATPASGNTNENWNFTHHTLVVTNQPIASGAGSTTLVISNQHMASLRSDGASTGSVSVSRADGGVDLLPWGGGTSGGSGILSNVTEGTSNKWDAATGTLIINTNPPPEAGGSTTSAYQFLAGYTYTGGETAVTFSWTSRYRRIDVQVINQFVPTNTAGAVAIFGVTVNGIANPYRVDIKYDTSSDAHPNTVHSFASSYPFTTNFFPLYYCALRNVNVAYQRTMTAAHWTLISNNRGIHMDGRGHASFASEFSGEYTFDSFGTAVNVDQAGENFITNLTFSCWNVTNGATLVAHTSNSTISAWGVQ